VTKILSGTELRLGIDGFDYSHLFRPDRLKDLFGIFDQSLATENPELFARWSAYRSNSGEVRTSIEISALLIAVSGHVSRFVSRLFGIEEEAAALAAATADQEPVFRFKVDFVRRRVLPNLNKIQASVAPDAIPTLEDAVSRLRRAASDASDSHADLELATAKAAAKLLDPKAREVRVKQLDAPLDSLFKELQQRLDSLLTAAQRQSSAGK